ncbi:MAG TPA: replication-associated recombination protein A [Chthoniobacteraceae bacterium]|jgi:putative ATPase|nr:replication-associated recombination protein A [Chthoniobacteraceae bacterium]
MADLFEETSAPAAAAAATAAQPLAARMRPRTLDEYAGQRHILGQGKLLRRAIEADRISSILLFGPPGVGKTTLAQIIAHATQCRFERLSGVESSVGDMRRVIAAAANRLQTSGMRTILFIDEIHRFNKAQQDILLPDVESGVIRLIGATTHNPFFYINSPLVSRSQVFQLEPLAPEDLENLMRRALADTERGLGEYKVEMHADALRHLAVTSDGDARKCLNALEVGVLTTPPGNDGVIHFSRPVAEESIQRKAVVYDADEDQHYDTISAFIKSMRGSDPDAAIYWLAKMLYAGEDIRFIARRIVICASEDVGMADPQALMVAVAAQQAVEFVGMPEAQIPLAQATIYIATAPKSNRACAAIGKAMSEVKEGVTLPVPKHLRDTHYKSAKKLGHGQGYQYSHDYEGGYVPQAYLPEGRIYYEPTEIGHEKRVKERLDYWRALFEEEQKRAEKK